MSLEARPLVFFPKSAWLYQSERAQRFGLFSFGDYRTGENAAGISSLFSCRIGRTPLWAGQPLPGRRDSSRTRLRSARSLYTQV
jgi:hypothetical protein